MKVGTGVSGKLERKRRSVVRNEGSKTPDYYV